MIYLLIGRRERGKTTLAYSMARKLKKRAVIDARRMIQRVDVERVLSASELHPALGDLVHDAGTNEVIYQPTDDDLSLAFESFVSSVKRMIVANPNMTIAIMIDEASFYNLEDARFQWLAKCTTRDRVHILITAHRPADIPTSVRAIADHWCIFATTQEHDLKVIEQRSGSPRVVDAVRRLKDRDYVHWDDARGTMATCSDAASWYVSLSMHGGKSKSPQRLIDDVDIGLPSANDEEWELE